MIQHNISNCRQVQIYQQISGITARALGVQILRYYFEKYLDRESKCFEIVGPVGVVELPGYLGRRHARRSRYVTAEFPCNWTGGNYFRGVHFFRKARMRKQRVPNLYNPFMFASNIKMNCCYFREKFATIVSLVSETDCFCFF